KKAFVVNRIGDFGFLIGIFMLLATLAGQAPHPVSLLSFPVLRQFVPVLAGVAPLVTLFLFIGATGKSAQIPLYVWLPDAMAG
ncbi:MAG TPA: NADH-quinone oxidoreductase subunit L, partial [Deltaproteobacteria bacterium]|nr:NADH-quinone oxidoreductase subunit L [Deltaproteobacteria bacterium]